MSDYGHVLHLCVLLVGPAKFIVPLKESETVEGSTVILECQVSRIHKVTWLKDGKPIKTDKRHKITTEGTTHRLTITESELDDEAEYTAQLPDDESKATLWVEGMHDETLSAHHI